MKLKGKQKKWKDRNTFYKQRGKYSKLSFVFEEIISYRCEN